MLHHQTQSPDQAREAWQQVRQAVAAVGPVVTQVQEDQEVGAQ